MDSGQGETYTAPAMRTRADWMSAKLTEAIGLS